MTRFVLALVYLAAMVGGVYGGVAVFDLVTK
jgi:hypothetical protein